MLLHVIDIGDLDMEWKIEVVEKVLSNIGCGDKKIIYVFNKIDLMQFDQTEVFAEKYKKYDPVFVSATAKSNLEGLKSKIEHIFNLKAL